MRGSADEGTDDDVADGTTAVGLVCPSTFLSAHSDSAIPLTMYLTRLREYDITTIVPRMSHGIFGGCKAEISNFDWRRHGR